MVQNNGTNVSMTTEELIILDQQARESLNEIQNMSNIVIHGLLRELRPYMGSLYKLCEHVGELDLLMALAEASIAGSYIRPEFDDYTSIRNCVHPLLEYNSQMYPVTNDVFSSPEHNFTIVTGPNMGGKSIYIKQVALLQIMAQVGCFLPCSDAVLRISDHIFSRIGFNDSIELGASTYVLEMKEMQYILKNVTPTSLIIIDELCRGTSSEEGASVAWAICEKLAQTSAFTFFTTHFLYLTKLQDLYSNVVNLCTSVSEELNPSTNVKSLKYHHKIEKGVTCIDHYGLGLARKTNINPATLDLATELADFLSSHRKSNVETPQARSSFSYLYDLNSSVKMEKRKSSEPERAISNVFNAFKSKHRGILLELKNQLLIDTSESESLNQKDTTARSIHSNGLEKGDYDPDPESTVGSTPLFSKTHGISSDGGPVLGKETSKVNDQQNNRVECESNVKENQSATTPAAKNISQSSDMITYPHSTLPPRTIFSSEEVSSSNRSSERFLTPNRRGYCSTPNTDDNRERNNLTTERPLIVQYSSDESESQNPSPRFGGYSLEMSFSPRPQPSYEYGNRRNVCINPPVFIPESDEKSNSSETRYNILETILDAQCSSKHIDTRETMPNVANDNFESDDEIMGDVLDSLNSSQLSTQILARELTSPSNDSTMCYEDLYKETVNEIMEDFNLENDTDDLQLYLTPPMEFRD